VLLVAGCALMDTSVVSSAVYMLELYFSIILQENVDTVKVERVENVGEEDGMKIKTEVDWIQLVRTVKSEEEVSVYCWCVLW
jgi:hypothetical protein